MPNVDGIMIREAGDTKFSFYPGTSTSYPPEPDIEVRLAGPATNLAGIIQETAPARVSDPVLSGSAVLGGTLTRQSPGVVTGNPLPEMGSPLWAMRADSNAAAQIIESASGETLSVDDAVFDVGHQIRTGTRFANSQGEITLWSNWVVVAAVPQITAEPLTLTAGQPATIRFNTAVDTVTVAQGSTTLTATRVGNTNDWTFTPATTEPVTIGATKAGWMAYSATITPAAAPAAFGQTSGNRMAITGVTDGTPAITYTSATPDEWDGDYAIPTLAALADGPRAVIPPRITGTPAVGETVSLDLGLTASLDQTEPSAAWEWPDGSIGDSYVVRDEDQGTSVSLDVVFTDSRGSRTISTNALAVPAAPVQTAWWDPLVDAHPGSADIDLLNDRARINGVTYATLAAARTAGAIIVNANGSDTIPVTIPASVTLAVHGVYGAADNIDKYMCALDDGADGDLLDNLIPVMQIGSGGSSYRLQGGSWRNGTKTIGVLAPTSGQAGEAFRTAFRIKSGGVAVAQSGTLGTTSTYAFTMPTVTTLVLENASTGDKAWLGPKGRVIFVNGDIDNAALTALSTGA